MKVAIAGAGYIAAIHARAVKTNGGEVVAVIEKFPQVGARFARRFRIERQYESVEEALAQAQFDALVIGTPNYLHAPQAIAALKAGVAVMVEKPMALNAAECQEMAEASQKSGAPLMVAHCWRFDRDVLWLKRQAPRLGRIFRTKGYGVHANWGPAGWFTQRQFAGGGAMVDMGVHAIDTARFLLGDPQPVSVFAKIGTYYKDYDVDDTGVVIVEWDNGAVSYIESGWWQPHSDAPEAATQLYGQKGFGQLFPTLLEIPDWQTRQVQVVPSGYAFPRKEHCPQRMYNAQMKYFLGCVATRQTPVPGWQEGLTNMRIVDAAYESNRTGRVAQV